MPHTPTHFDIDEFLRQNTRAAPGAPATPAPAVTAAQPGKAFRAARLAGKGARALGAARLTPALAIGAMGFGIADKIQETENNAFPENRPERALKILSGADITGIGGRIGRFLTDRPEPAEAGTLGPAGRDFLASGRSPDLPARLPAAAPASADETGPSIADELLRAPTHTIPSGTGAISFGARPAQLVDTRGGSRADNSPKLNRTGNPAGDFTQAILGLKRISGDNERRLAQGKVAAASRSAEGTFLKGRADLGTAQLSAALAAEYLDPRTTPERRSLLERSSAVLRGRAAPGNLSIPVGGVGLNPTKDPSVVFNKSSGKTKLVFPTNDITIAQAVASAKKNKNFKSVQQVRRDLKNNPRFNLVD